MVQNCFQIFHFLILTNQNMLLSLKPKQKNTRRTPQLLLSLIIAVLILGSSTLDTCNQITIDSQNQACILKRSIMSISEPLSKSQIFIIELNIEGKSQEEKKSFFEKFKISDPKEILLTELAKPAEGEPEEKLEDIIDLEFWRNTLFERKSVFGIKIDSKKTFKEKTIRIAIKEPNSIQNRILSYKKIDNKILKRKLQKIPLQNSRFSLLGSNTDYIELKLPSYTSEISLLNYILYFLGVLTKIFLISLYILNIGVFPTIWPEKKLRWLRSTTWMLQLLLLINLYPVNKRGLLQGAIDNFIAGSRTLLFLPINHALGTYSEERAALSGMVDMAYYSFSHLETIFWGILYLVLFGAGFASSKPNLKVLGKASEGALVSFFLPLNLASLITMYLIIGTGIVDIFTLIEFIFSFIIFLCLNSHMFLLFLNKSPYIHDFKDGGINEPRFLMEIFGASLLVFVLAVLSDLEYLAIFAGILISLGIFLYEIYKRWNKKVYKDLDLVLGCLDWLLNIPILLFLLIIKSNRYLGTGWLKFWSWLFILFFFIKLVYLIGNFSYRIFKRENLQIISKGSKIEKATQSEAKDTIKNPTKEYSEFQVQVELVELVDQPKKKEPIKTFQKKETKEFGEQVGAPMEPRKQIPRPEGPRRKKPAAEAPKITSSEFDMYKSLNKFSDPFRADANKNLEYNARMEKDEKHRKKGINFHQSEYYRARIDERLDEEDEISEKQNQELSDFVGLKKEEKYRDSSDKKKGIVYESEFVGTK